MRHIELQIEPFLRGLGIVYGIHFEQHEGEKGLHIVLECIPFPSTLEKIEARLREIVKDIPSKPVPTSVKLVAKKAPPTEEVATTAIGRAQRPSPTIGRAQRPS